MKWLRKRWVFFVVVSFFLFFFPTVIIWTVFHSHMSILARNRKYSSTTSLVEVCGQNKIQAHLIRPRLKLFLFVCSILCLDSEWLYDEGYDDGEKKFLSITVGFSVYVSRGGFSRRIYKYRTSTTQAFILQKHSIGKVTFSAWVVFSLYLAGNADRDRDCEVVCWLLRRWRQQLFQWPRTYDNKRVLRANVLYSIVGCWRKLFSTISFLFSFLVLPLKRQKPVVAGAREEVKKGRKQQQSRKKKPGPIFPLLTITHQPTTRLANFYTHTNKHTHTERGDQHRPPSWKQSLPPQKANR